MEILTKIYVPLDESERRALIQLSLAEKRDPRKQAALFIRQSLVNLGLLPPAPTIPPKVEVQHERA